MNFKRRIVAVAVAGSAALLALAGCADSGSTGSDASAKVNADAPLYSSLPDDVKAAGKIVNAGDLTYAPFEAFEADGKTVSGIDVDIAEALTEQIGVPFEWQDVKTDAALSGIQSKRYNTLLASMTYTDERAKTYDYVTYLKAASGFLVVPDKVKNYTNLEDFCGTKIATLRGTIQTEQTQALSDQCVASGKAAIDVQTLDSDQSAILQIRQGGIDALVTNSAVGSYAVSQSDGSVQMVPGLILGDSVYGIMLNKDASELRDVLHTAMNNIIEDGSYAEILKKWGISDLALDESLINNAR